MVTVAGPSPEAKVVAEHNERPQRHPARSPEGIPPRGSLVGSGAFRSRAMRTPMAFEANAKVDPRRDDELNVNLRPTWVTVPRRRTSGARSRTGRCH